MHCFQRAVLIIFRRYRAFCHWYKRWIHFSLLLAGGFIALLISEIVAGQALESHYAITGRAAFNQPEFYPIQQSLPVDRYRPIAPWMGRLLLPTRQEQGASDWVWLEVTHAPATARELIGQRIRLEWSQKPDVQREVTLGTQAVQFVPLLETLRQTKADLYPDRLNGRSQVGPLQAIAGARPKDDVTIAISEGKLLQRPGGDWALQIEQEPRLETGRYYTLVKILGPVPNAPPEFIPPTCPGGPPCPSELFQVQHYNPATGAFDGVKETVRIPQQPRDGNGVYASTPRELEKSPAGEAGWYLYGAQDRTKLFTVQAIKPRALVQLKPQKILLNPDQSLDYINQANWQETEQRKGTVQTVVINPWAKTAEEAIEQWQEGDRALVIHLFGGRGGAQGEGSAMGTVTGHFAYGFAKIIRDPWTQELQWDVNYSQVYANNIEGIISGEHSWANYMGNLQRGWLGTRPVADVLVRLDTIAQDYDFGGHILSPLAELSRQLRLIANRYRTGDGTGIASVTAATSCVQDSNQALFTTIQIIRKQVESNPEIQRWWSSHPADPTVQRFERLVALGEALEKELVPFGLVRQDWKTNADVLAGTLTQGDQFVRVADGSENLIVALASWRTILPRQAQDQLSTLFLRHKAELWYLTTYQVGGNDLSIVPIAPTRPFALWTVPGTTLPLLTILVTRLLGAINWPNLWGWGVGLLSLLSYGAIALPLGFSQGFLQFQPWPAPWWRYGLVSLRLLLMPALIEELVFRVMLLPDPRAAITGQMWVIWAMASLVLFVVYHPVNAKTFYPPGNPTFLRPIFLMLTGLLGIVCTVVYFFTQSLLLITLVHGVVVIFWLLLLGGMEHLQCRGSRINAA